MRFRFIFQSLYQALHGKMRFSRGTKASSEALPRTYRIRQCPMESRQSLAMRFKPKSADIISYLRTKIALLLIRAILSRLE